MVRALQGSPTGTSSIKPSEHAEEMKSESTPDPLDAVACDLNLRSFYSEWRDGRISLSLIHI